MGILGWEPYIGLLKNLQGLTLTKPKALSWGNYYLQNNQIMFRGVQKFAAYDKHGKLVAGDLEKELTVEDIWVFEKHLSQPEAKWRLCGRLSVWYGNATSCWLVKLTH